MSKLLHHFAKTHMPDIAAKMTPENGYKPDAHLVASDLVSAGIISAEEGKNFEDCISEIAAGDNDVANLLKAAASGEIDKSKLNDDDFLKNFMKVAA